ncbi:Phosphoinositide phospholipase C [Aphelenchoides besseyi]|nr:Phosphoinositide phospholipase C [Aphelenchoides besseyi]
MTTVGPNAAPEVEEFLRVLEEGIEVKRVKSTKIHKPSVITIDEHQKKLQYPATANPLNKFVGKCSAANRHKKIDITNLMEVREGYKTDGLHKASKIFEFRERAPESCCFSIIYRHPKFVCKSVDFVTSSPETKQKWINALNNVILAFSRNIVSFDEKLWLKRNFKNADLNRNGQISFDELWKLLKKLNLQMSEYYVRALFRQVLEQNNHANKQGLDESEFFQLFQILSDLPEYKSALRLSSANNEEKMDAKGLVKFLREEQKFDDIDESKAQSIIDMFETGDENEKKTYLTTNGFRRLLQSRWGFIMKPGHENVFQDMDQPLCSYFINGSHNTYLTGLQVRGNATVEGYISAMRKGARLLELDVFDGEQEPQITHKRTFIGTISLRDTLKCILQYAFELSPYPLILTLENHVGYVQQGVMAEIFVDILGDKLYIPKDDAGSKPLPSPNDLKNKILLRGKVQTETAVVDDDLDSPSGPEERKTPRSPTHPDLGKLIALPSTKLSLNLYSDIQDHPYNVSPSLSEGKVESYLEAASPLVVYTTKHFVKSYPRGIRQDSSNMSPIPSFLCGIQCCAMNMQTPGEDLDLVNGLFQINGNCGYVLKPKVLRDGIDPRVYALDQPPKILRIAIICGQWLPKSEPGMSDVVDPYVTIEIFGVPADESKSRTRAIRNNGFNPVWNEEFEFRVRCPELAILRFVVKDFDSTSSNDFIGEYSIQLESLRPGYSHIRLNTGHAHSPDDAASIFVRIDIDDRKKE